MVVCLVENTNIIGLSAALMVNIWKLAKPPQNKIGAGNIPAPISQ
jgi:hypothetical protein